MQTESEPRKRQPQGQLKIGSFILEVDRRRFQSLLRVMVMFDNSKRFDDGLPDRWLTGELKAWDAYWSDPSTGGKVVILDELAQHPDGLQRLVHLLRNLESFAEGRPGVISPNEPLRSVAESVREWLAAVIAQPE